MCHLLGIGWDDRLGRLGYFGMVITLYKKCGFSVCLNLYFEHMVGLSCQRGCRHCSYDEITGFQGPFTEAFRSAMICSWDVVGTKMPERPAKCHMGYSHWDHSPNPIIEGHSKYSHQTYPAISSRSYWFDRWSQKT